MSVVKGLELLALAWKFLNYLSVAQQAGALLLIGVLVCLFWLLRQHWLGNMDVIHEAFGIMAMCILLIVTVAAVWLLLDRPGDRFLSGAPPRAPPSRTTLPGPLHGAGEDITNGTY